MEFGGKQNVEAWVMQNKRQGEIVRYLSEVKFSKIEQLAEVFQVS